MEKEVKRVNAPEEEAKELMEDACHLPYILLRKTQRRRVRCIPLSLLLRFYIRHLVRLLGTAGEEFDT